MGSAPGRPWTSSTTVAASERSTRSPAACAGRTTTSRSSSAVIAPTGSPARRNASARPGCSAQRAWKSARTAMRTRSRESGSRAVSSRSRKRVRSASSRQRVNTSSNWSTTTQLSGSSSATVSRCPYVSMRPGARGQHPQHRLATLPRDVRAEPGQEPGAQQGRLTAAGGAEDGREAVGGDQAAELLDQSVAAEEQVVVVRFEAGEAPVRRRVVPTVVRGRRGRPRPRPPSSAAPTRRGRPRRPGRIPGRRRARAADPRPPPGRGSSRRSRRRPRPSPGRTGCPRSGATPAVRGRVAARARPPGPGVFRDAPHSTPSGSGGDQHTYPDGHA